MKIWTEMFLCINRWHTEKQKQTNKQTKWKKLWLIYDKWLKKSYVQFLQNQTSLALAALLVCRYAAWSSLAVSELQLSVATPLWPYHRAASLPSWRKFNCLRSAAVGKAARLSIYNWHDAACRLVIPVRQVVLAQLYKNHHQSGNAASGKLVWKQHYLPKTKQK